MRRTRLALLLVCTMFLAGCIGADTAEWGSNGIDVDFSQQEVEITTNLGASKTTYENLSPVGCEVGEEVISAKNASDAIEFTGFLSASVLYDSHDPINGARNMETAVTAAVAIQSMAIGDAENMKDGEGARIDIKQWDRPLSPETRGTGTVDLDDIDQEEESDWYILGLIPTSENINDGFRALSEWHKPITIHGYLISSTLANGSAFTIDGKQQNTGYHRTSGSQAHNLDENCNLIVGTDNYHSVYVLVEKIEIDGRVVSSSGNHGDEWKLGDVPFIGRAGFITFFLIVGVGGSIGMFLLSQMIVRDGAKETMKTLLGEEGLAKIKKVAADLKRDRKSGSISPTERKRQQDKADREALKLQQSSKKSAKKDEALSGFDLDSALSGDSSTDDGPSDFGRGSSSVVATEESIKLDKEMSDSEVVGSAAFGQQESWSPPTKRESASVSNVVSKEQTKQRTEHFSSVRSTSTKAVKKKAAKAPVKRRAAKKRKAVAPEPQESEPQYEEKTESQTFDDDDDFSDFSF